MLKSAIQPTVVTANELADNKQRDLLSSLSSSKRFFHNITVEPVVFMAIFALFIELPTIQDLIFTKICLQNVVNQQTYLSQSANSSSIGTLTKRKATNEMDHHILVNNSTSHIHLPLVAAGRIKTISYRSVDNNSSDEHVESVPTKASEIHIDQSSRLSLCEKGKKSELPSKIREQIFEDYSLFWLKYQLIICILSALSCPYWGGMSDRIGRLVPLNVPIAIAAITNLIAMIFATLISVELDQLYSVNWLYFDAILIGMTGGLAVIMISAFGFIGDTTSIEDRSGRVLILETVINVATSLGFFVTYYLLKLGLSSFLQQPWLNRHAISFSCCIVLNCICILYTFVRLRHHKFHRFLNNFEREQQESVSGETCQQVASCSSQPTRAGVEITRISGKTTPVAVLGPNNINNTDNFQRRSHSSLNGYPTDTSLLHTSSDRSLGTILTLRYYKQTYVTLTKPRQSRATILLLLLCGFISSTCLCSLISLLYIYLRSEPFNWNSSQYSSWNSKSSLSKMLALISLSLCMRFFKDCIVPDPLVGAIGFLSRGIGLLMLGLAQSASLVNWALLAFLFSDFTMPSIRSLLSKLVIQEELGKIYSCLGAILSLCFVVSNSLFYLAFTTISQQHFYRISFLVISALQFSAFAIMLTIYTNLRKSTIIAL